MAEDSDIKFIVSTEDDLDLSLEQKYICTYVI